METARSAPVRLARLMRLDDDGAPWIAGDDGAPCRAAAVAGLARADAERALAEGTPVVVAEVGGAPLVLGFLATALTAPATVRIEAGRALTLRCGRSMIELTDAGVTVRAPDILSRAARTHRIQGGAVRVN